VRQSTDPRQTPDQKRSEQFGVRVNKKLAERIQAVSDALHWTDSNTIAVAVAHGIGHLERIVEQVKDKL
jgi:hypothetical protein